MRPLRLLGTLSVGSLLTSVVLVLTSVVGLDVAGGPPVATAAGTPAVITPATAQAQAPRRPNIVLVMTDDMRVDDLRYAPSVRRLIADNGLTFRNSFSPYPLCCPARASLLTGTYAHNHRVYWHESPYGYGSFDDSRTLATSLKKVGYNTGYVGKYLNKYGTARSKVTGVPSWRYVPNGWTDWRTSVENPGNAGFHGGTYHYLDTPFNVNGRIDNRYRGVYGTDVIGNFSVDVAGRFARASKPFFLYVNYVAPHFGGPHERDDPGSITDARGVKRDFESPYVPPGLRGRFDAQIPRAPGIARNGEASERNVSDKPEFLRSKTDISRAEQRAMREVSRQRAESIFALDRHVGRLVRKLKSTREWDDTVVMFTSDNGFFAGEHRMRSGKVHSYEPSLRIPFVVTGPGMRSNKRGGESRYDPITIVDITATILDLANAAAPEPGDGVSRLPTMLTGDQGWRTPVVVESTHGTYKRRKGFHDARTGIGVRTARYSMTLYRSGDSELYDLVTDPHQMTSVWNDAAYASVQADLISVWRATKDCAADVCRTPLPASLAAKPGQVGTWTRAYWKAIDRKYGYR